MKVTNNSKRLIVLNYRENGKGFNTLLVGAGETKENEHLVDSDVAFYVKKGSISAEVVEKNKTTTPAEPVVLPDEVTEESLKAMEVKDLRRYCNENDIEVPKGSKKDDIIVLILESLQPKE